mgnify:CR=1 FL=1
MGFLRKLLGLEVKPGEPAPLSDSIFYNEIAGKELPCFVYFFSLWCSSCQVMGGLLNEIGPEYADKACFYKIDVSKNPEATARFEIKGVPTVIALKKGEPVDRHTGLVPIDEIRDWIEKNL